MEKCDSSGRKHIRRMLTPRPDGPRGLLFKPPAPGGLNRHGRYLPSEDLAGFIEHFWSVAWDLRATGPLAVETLPHPSVHVVIEPGQSRVVGITRARFSRTLQDEGWVFGIKFHPGAFAPLIDAPVSSLTDRIVPLVQILGSDGRALEAAVVAAPDDGVKVERAEGFLRGRLPALDPRCTEARAIVDLIRADRRILQVQDIVGHAQLSTRSLQRLFTRYVGVSPKWVIQRFRMHEAAEQLAAGTTDGAQLALELGYVDQAHFIRDFKAMVGVSPNSYASLINRDRRSPVP